MTSAPTLTRVLVALTPGWVAWAASQALIGWLVFTTSRSPSLVGLAFALRFAPFTLVGVPAGTLSDRFGRLVVLRVSNYAGAAISLAIAAFIGSHMTSVILLLAASACLGFADAGRQVSGANLVYDLAGGTGPERAVAASNFVASIGSALGGAIAGVELSAAVPTLTAVMIGVGYVSAALLLTGVREMPITRSDGNFSFFAEARHGLGLLLEVPTVGLLIAVGLLVEVFAFSSVALDPVFAGEVFFAGPLGLGIILASRAMGRFVGSGTLAIAPPRQSIGRFLALAVFAFGAALCLYAGSPLVLVAVPLVFVSGVAGVLIDVLVLAAVQTAVGATSRGRAAGLWVLMVGLQPIGVLEIGILAQVTGPRLAQALNGLIVAALGLLLLFTAIGRRLRNVQVSNTSPSENRRQQT